MHHVNPSLLIVTRRATHAQTHKPAHRSARQSSSLARDDDGDDDVRRERRTMSTQLRRDGARRDSRATRARRESGNYSFRLVNDVDCLNRGRARDARVG